MSTARTRILIVDDHTIVRKGLAMVLRLEPDFEVAGEAADGAEGLTLARQLQPDLVLLDLMMPEMDGQSLAAALRSELPEVRILFLSGAELDERLLDVLAQGVDGYVMKDIEPDDLRQAIRAVARGEAYLQPAVARRLLDRFSGQARAQATAMTAVEAYPEPGTIDQPVVEELTPRELEILQHMAGAATYREIAAELFISEETVRSHAKHILSKLGQPNRVQAVLTAVRLGLIELPE